MSQHPGELTVERTLPASEAAPGLSETLMATDRRTSAAPKRDLRKTLLAAASSS